ncbi:Palmitoyltransferase ZDHHC17 like protein [Argiope bruennichi]|uniref:Palmitoyltransferase ZDHHC17 like protein n=1 Tax=Argiope bruennichi TaxID=94029 RepID=A0A8T0E360_ARGBR|nr:Palmitoyltransferase ZDHHC17 like protein [Argiope bruennichi]
MDLFRTRHHSDPSSDSTCIPLAPAEDYSTFDIVKATQFGIFERCQEIIEGGYDVNRPDSENVTLLHWAAINNRQEIVRYYISKGAHVDTIGGELHSTPLHWATRQGHLAMVVLLMHYGADPSLTDGEEMIPQDFPFNLGQFTMVDLPSSKQTLIWGVFVENFNAVNLLLKAGASVDEKNAEKDTPITMAKRLNQTYILKRLEEARRDRERTLLPINL